MADAGEPDDGLTPYERERAARIAANADMMRRLGLPELGSALRLPSTPSGSGGAHRRAAATIDPDTKLENLDSKYDNNLDARNRAIRSVALWHWDPTQWVEESKVHWGTLKEKRIVRRWAKAAAEAAANERRALAGHESVGAHEIENENDMLRKIAELVGEDAGAPFGVERVCTKCHIELAPIPGFNMSLMKNCYACGGTLAPASVGATLAAPGSASDDVADPEPAAAPPTPVVSPAGGGGRRGKRVNRVKKDPTTVKGAATFIALGIPLICSVCDSEETPQWYGGSADPPKPVCRICTNRKLAATRGNCACCGIADAGVMRKSRYIEGAPWLCRKCWDKDAPADRACASCKAGVDAVLSWGKSKRIEGAPWLCNPCYCREHTEILTAAGATCVKCKSSETGSWHNSPDVPGGKVCMKCYHQDNPGDPGRSHKRKK